MAGKIVYVADIAVAAGWTTQRTRRTLQKLGIVRKPLGRWITTEGELHRVYPELLDLLERPVTPENALSD